MQHVVGGHQVRLAQPALPPGQLEQLHCHFYPARTRPPFHDKLIKAADMAEYLSGCRDLAGLRKIDKTAKGLWDDVRLSREEACAERERIQRSGAKLPVAV